MGFLGFTLLLAPFILPFYLLELLFTDPSAFVEIIANMPDYFASVFSGIISDLPNILTRFFDLLHFIK